MRPVTRGASPRAGDFEDYRDAFDELVSRIGIFCSYCERRIATQLAVEHVQPKGLAQYEHLTGRWDNFLLACVNCNSTKGHQDVLLANVLLPDRDNTAAAYVYTKDGKIQVRANLTPHQQALARETLRLTGLDRPTSSVIDSNGQLVAIDRVAQRMEVWLIALDSKSEFQQHPTDAFRRQIVRTAIGHGFFSIWMAVFEDDVAVRKLLIREFKAARDCFDPETTAIISPRPTNGLPDGAKL